MPINFMRTRTTQQDEVRSQLLGTIKKGAPQYFVENKETGEKQPRVGKDQEWFRLKPEIEGPTGDAIEAAFRKEYGDKPKRLEILLAMPRAAANLEDWMLHYQGNRMDGKGGYLFSKCNSDNIICEWNGMRMVYKEKPCLWNRETQKECPRGCRPSVTLYFHLPRMMREEYQRQFSGYFALSCSSLNDLRHLQSVITDLDRWFPEGVQGVPLLLERVKKDVNCPAFGKDRKTPTGSRKKEEKWMLYLRMGDSSLIQKKLARATEQQHLIAAGASPNQLQLPGTAGSCSWWENHQQDEIINVDYRQKNRQQPYTPGVYNTPKPVEEDEAIDVEFSEAKPEIQKPEIQKSEKPKARKSKNPKTQNPEISKLVWADELKAAIAALGLSAEQVAKSTQAVSDSQQLDPQFFGDEQYRLLLRSLALRAAVDRAKVTQSDQIELLKKKVNVWIGQAETKAGGTPSAAIKLFAQQLPENLSQIKI